MERKVLIFVRVEFGMFCLEGQGDLVSSFMIGIIGVIIWLIGVIKVYLLSPPDPPSEHPLNNFIPS